MMRNETFSSVSSPSSWSSWHSGASRSRGPSTWSAEVMVRLEQDGEGMLFEAVRIGRSGMFLRSDYLFESGDRVYVSFPTPDGEVLDAVAEVTELDFGDLEPGSAGMELVFRELEPADRELLELAVSR